MAQKLTSTPNDGEYQDVLASEDEANTTATEDMFDGAQTVYAMILDNATNAQVVYYRFYDALTADPSSDVPDIKLRVAASDTCTVLISDGLSFTTGVTLRCTSGADDTDTTGPSTPAPVYVLGS